jgi:hypothetical protein
MESTLATNHTIEDGTENVPGSRGSESAELSSLEARAQRKFPGSLDRGVKKRKIMLRFDRQADAVNCAISCETVLHYE